MGRRHHHLSGHEFEQTPGDNEGQRSLVCCSSWGHTKSDTTEWLSNTKTFCTQEFSEICQLGGDLRHSLVQGLVRDLLS